MPQVNPNRIIWRAPTQNVDGSAIDYNLAYELEVDGEAVVTFPGTLNPNGLYSAEFADMPPIVGEAEIALRAFDTDNPRRKSAPSQTIQVAFFPNPNAPEDVTVTS
jgi:hypothetical protein